LANPLRLRCLYSQQILVIDAPHNIVYISIHMAKYLSQTKAVMDTKLNANAIFKTLHAKERKQILSITISPDIAEQIKAIIELENKRSHKKHNLSNVTEELYKAFINSYKAKK